MFVGSATISNQVLCVCVIELQVRVCSVEYCPYLHSVLESAAFPRGTLPSGVQKLFFKGLVEHTLGWLH